MSVFDRISSGSILAGLPPAPLAFKHFHYP